MQMSKLLWLSVVHLLVYIEVSLAPRAARACNSTALYTVEVGDSLSKLATKIGQGCTQDTRVSRYRVFNAGGRLASEDPATLIFCDPDSERVGAGRRVMVFGGNVVAIKEGGGTNCLWGK